MTKKRQKLTGNETTENAITGKEKETKQDEDEEERKSLDGIANDLLQICPQQTCDLKLKFIAERNQEITECLGIVFGKYSALGSMISEFLCSTRIFGVDMGSINLATDDIGFDFETNMFVPFSWSLDHVCDNSSATNDQTNRQIVHHFQSHPSFNKRLDSLLEYDFIVIELQPSILNLKTAIASYSLWTLFEEMKRRFLLFPSISTTTGNNMTSAFDPRSLPLVRFISATLKITFAQEYPLRTMPDQYSSDYNYNKAVSREACKIILKHCNMQKELNFLLQHKKKDDLTDVRLMILGDFASNIYPFLDSTECQATKVMKREQPKWMPNPKIQSLDDTVFKMRKKNNKKPRTKQSTQGGIGLGRKKPTTLNYIFTRS